MCRDKLEFNDTVRRALAPRGCARLHGAGAAAVAVGACAQDARVSVCTCACTQHARIARKHTQDFFIVDVYNANTFPNDEAAWPAIDIDVRLRRYARAVGCVGSLLGRAD